jgi:hypothetical protein
MNFSEFINGKRIVAVGPAPSAFDNTESIIESFDIIMRFNSAVPVSEAAKPFIGRRTDILCNCLEEDPISGGKLNPRIWKDEGVKWILSPYPETLWFSKDNINRFKNINNGLLPLECYDINRYNLLESHIKTRPNSGLLGITHLLNFTITELYVTGFTFGRGGYQKGYKDHITPEQYNKLANGRWHSQKPQEDYFREKIATDKRVTLDKYLTDLFS